MTGGKVKREKLYLHFHDERGCGVASDEWHNVSFSNNRKRAFLYVEKIPVIIIIFISIFIWENGTSIWLRIKKNDYVFSGFETNIREYIVLEY